MCAYCMCRDWMRTGSTHLDEGGLEGIEGGRVVCRLGRVVSRCGGQLKPMGLPPEQRIYIRASNQATTTCIYLPVCFNTRSIKQSTHTEPASTYPSVYMQTKAHSNTHPHARMHTATDLCHIRHMTHRWGGRGCRGPPPRRPPPWRASQCRLIRRGGGGGMGGDERMSSGFGGVDSTEESSWSARAS